MFAVAMHDNGASILSACPASNVTFRVYVRWPRQRVTDRTTTDSKLVADTAYKELLLREDLAASGALGIAYTEDQRQIFYCPFGDSEEPPKA